jgi:hypothetical protein
VAKWRAITAACYVASRCRLGALMPLSMTVRMYKGTDKWLHGYVPWYERHIGPRRWRRNRILEIGVGGYQKSQPGGSLRVWRDYFPLSKIAGMDIHPKTVDLGSRVSFVQGDQVSTVDLNRATAALGGSPNIVIDDGSHYVGHAIASFEHLFPTMPRGSIYVVEDMSTSYWEDFGGAVEPPGTTAVGMAMELVHSVQAGDTTFVRRPKWGPTPEFKRTDVAAIHVYPGIFFVEKA